MTYFSLIVPPRTSIKALGQRPWPTPQPALCCPKWAWGDKVHLIFYFWLQLQTITLLLKLLKNDLNSLLCTSMSSVCGISSMTSLHVIIYASNQIGITSYKRYFYLQIINNSGYSNSKVSTLLLLLTNSISDISYNFKEYFNFY